MSKRCAGANVRYDCGPMRFGILGLLLLAGCAGDDCDGVYLEEQDLCFEDDSGKEPERDIADDGGKLYAVTLGTTEPVPIRDASNGYGVELDQPVAVELLAAAAIAYVADGDRILSVRILDGRTAVLSSAARGSGPPLDEPVGLEWESGAGRLLVHDRGLDAVLAVDLITGDRVLTLLPFSPASPEEERRTVDAAAGVAYVVIRGG